MTQKTLLKVLQWTLISLCTFQTVHAQIHLDIDGQIDGKIDDIISLTLKISNDTEQAFRGQVHITAASGLRVLGDEQRIIDVEAFGTRFVPIRLRIDRTARAGESPIQVAVLDTTAKIVGQIGSMISVRESRNIFLQVHNQRELMQHPGDSIRIPIYIKNTGNTDENIQIIFSTPGSQGNLIRDFEAIDLALSASKDTTLVLGFIVDRQMLNHEQFSINVTGLYNDMDLFGNARISIQNVASRRSYSNPLLEHDIWMTQRNQISLSVRNIFHQYQTRQLQARAVHRLGSGHEISYSLNAQQWGSDLNPTVNNTWVRLDHNNRGFTIGNISESMEKHIFGRGLTLHYGDRSRRWRTEAGIVDKGYNLIGLNASDRWFDGYSAFVRTRHGMDIKSKFAHSATALYDRDPYENAESILYVSTLHWKPTVSRPNTQAQFLLGGGLSRPLDPLFGNQGQVTNPTPQQWDSAWKPSVASSLSFNTGFDRYSITSNNYFSSGYYPGTRRGIIQLTQRITRKTGRANFWAAYHLSNFEPAYFIGQRTFPIHFSQSRGEMGVSLPLGTFASISIAPRIENERGKYIYNSTQPELLDQHSVKLHTMLGWRSNNNRHFMSLSQEAGWITGSNFDPGDPLSYRGTLSYSYKRFNLSGLYQYGNFSVSEQAYRQQSGRRPYRASLSTSWSRHFFNKKLQTDIGASVYRDYLTGSGVSTNNRLQYNFRKIALFSQIQWFQYYNRGAISTPVVYSQVGVIHKLPDNRRTKPAKRGQINLFTYYDHNNNGAYDKDDEIATGKSVLINNTLFLSDQQGKIQYSRVPRDRYRLTVPVEKGWYAPEFELNLDKRSKQWEIPLQKSGTLRGTIAFDYDPRLSLEINTSLEGFTVTARAENGSSFSTRTDDKGQYLLFLPVGNYELFLNEQEFPKHVFSDDSRQQTQIETGKVKQQPAFILNVERKSIKVKRFGT